MWLSHALAGGLVFLSASNAWAATPPDGGALAQVRRAQFEIAYDVNDAARPLRAVELWYSVDQGQTWRMHSLDEDRISPVWFDAPHEGLYGFYLRVTNAAGVSGPTPSPTTEPHFWAFVDHTPPVAQLHAPQVVHRGRDHAIAELRWSAVDEHLGNRPIDLAYRIVPDGPWCDVQTHLPNSGRYDWRIPPDVRGTVMFRITVRDRGGHAVQSASPAVSLEPDAAVDTMTPAVLQQEYTPVGDPTVPSAANLQRARELLRKGRRHSLRGEHGLAAARLRDALELDPRMPEALVELGSALYALDKFEPSARAYELALRQTPGEREALEGLARALMALNKHEAAELKLLQIVEADPEDVETWLHLGDVAIYRGNEVAAREYYLKAATLRPEAQSVATRARARLDDLPVFRRQGQDTMTR